MTGLLVLAIALAAAISFGAYRRTCDGRVRPAAASAPRLAAADLGVGLGRTATLLQFSSPVCAPCRSTHALLTELTEHEPDLTHIDLNAEERLDLAERLSIRRTPTVLLLDGAGVVRHRISGPPRRLEVLDALAALRPVA